MPRTSVPEVGAKTIGRGVAYPSRVSLYTLDDARELIAPVMIAAFDGWVDAGSAATTALGILADDGETRILGPGGTWRITSDRPHNVNAGPDGAVVIDVFTPVRSDWDALPVVEGAVPRWPTSG